MGIQVDTLTKNKKDWQKEYIDFSFNGKYISDFGMVAVSNGDRLSFYGSPSIMNEVSEVNGVDGQLFWGTHFGSLKRTFYLATDGITEKQLDELKQHFLPGVYGLFKESHLASRFSYCRVSDQTVFNFMPFRKNISFLNKDISINEYKGEATIVFEWDTPEFYSENNIITNEITEENYEELLREIYYNKIPYKESWKKTSKCIVGDENSAIQNGNIINDISNKKVSEIIFYNPSTFENRNILSITIPYEFTNNLPTANNPTYIASIFDDFNNKDKKKYNSIEITNSVDKDAVVEEANYNSSLLYTNPSIYYQTNLAISLAANFFLSSPNGNELELEEKLRLQITNPKVMGWAAAVLNIIKIPEKGYYNKETGNFTNGTINVSLSSIGGTEQALNWFQYFNIFMLYLFANCQDLSKYHPETGTWSFNNFTITFSSEDNTTLIRYNYNAIIFPESLTKFENIEENCGDSIISQYLKLSGGDTLNDDGTIKTIHHLRLRRGSNTYTADNISLVYKFTYI